MQIVINSLRMPKMKQLKRKASRVEDMNPYAD